MKTFYDRFWEVAKEKGYASPTEAGEAMGFPSATVSLWKSRGSTPRQTTVDRVAESLGVSADWLLGKPVDREGKPLTSGENQSEILTAQGTPINFYVPDYSFDTPVGEVEAKRTVSLREFADNVLRLALFGRNPDITAEDLQDVRDYAQLILAKKSRNKQQS